jgi:hypothetical protein
MADVGLKKKKNSVLSTFQSRDKADSRQED